MRTLLTLMCSLALAVPALARTPAEKAEKLIAGGLDYLEQQQQPDGSWQADPRVPPAITALALRVFVNSDEYAADDELVKKGYDALLAYQTAEGGIYERLHANYNTAIAISTLAAAQEEADDQRYQTEIERAVRFLRGLQSAQLEPSIDKDDPFYGGWGYGGDGRGRPDLSNTQMALQALHDAGVPSSGPAFQRALVFLSRLQNNSETNPNAWAGNDGGFIYGVTPGRDYESKAGEYVTPDGQRRFRSYGSMTYAGLKSMIYAGLTKDDPRVQAAWDWITSNWTLDENPGMAAADPEMAKHGLYYYYMTLGRALNAYDQPVIQTPRGNVDWRVALIDKLAEVQKDDGSWSGEARWREDDPTMVTSYVLIALENALEDLRQHPPK